MTSVSIIATTKADLQACLVIRRIVFTDEQGIPADADVDGLDDECIHFIHKENGIAVATARFLPKADSMVLQRMAVVSSCRKKKVGTSLLYAMLHYAHQEGYSHVELEAQDEVVPFYERNDFIAQGQPYLKVGRLHQPMVMVFRTRF